MSTPEESKTVEEIFQFSQQLQNKLMPVIEQFIDDNKEQFNISDSLSILISCYSTMLAQIYVANAQAGNVEVKAAINGIDNIHQRIRGELEKLLEGQS